MNASPSIRLVIKMAGQYTVSTDFNEIELEHLLEALLKFPEIDVPEAEKAGGATFRRPRNNSVHRRIAEGIVQRLALDAKKFVGNYVRWYPNISKNSINSTQNLDTVR